MKKLLFHVCCAPCFIAPYRLMNGEQKHDITAYWYNDNIHPYKEYEARLTSLTEWAEKESVPLIADHSYELKGFLNRINLREKERCYFCYYQRLLKTALKAKEMSFDMFSTTLLYSVYQKHHLIKTIGEQLADRYGIEFYYQDFRSLWKEGIELSKKEEMYRQKYCGCIYSEEERWHKKAKS